VLNISSPDAPEVTGIGSFLIVFVVSCAAAAPKLEKIKAASSAAVRIFGFGIINLPFSNLKSRMLGQIQNGTTQVDLGAAETFSGL
jgi:hypothetical protein